jgi:hypothetical protein
MFAFAEVTELHSAPRLWRAAMGSLESEAHDVAMAHVAVCKSCERVYNSYQRALTAGSRDGATSIAARQSQSKTGIRSIEIENSFPSSRQIQNHSVRLLEDVIPRFARDVVRTRPRRRGRPPEEKRRIVKMFFHVKRECAMLLASLDTGEAVDYLGLRMLYSQLDVWGLESEEWFQEHLPFNGQNVSAEQLAEQIVLPRFRLTSHESPKRWRTELGEEQEESTTASV